MSYSKADFSDPTTFLTTLWKSEYGATFDPHVFERFWDRDLKLVEQFYPAIFDSDPNQFHGRTAVGNLIVSLSADKDSSWCPSWWPVFEAAFRNGMITPVTWGCAARALYLYLSDGPKDDGAHLKAMLPGLRAADPRGLMFPEELEMWRKLPAEISLFRGGCAIAEEDIAQGISWTDTLSMAELFARGRRVQREAWGMEYRPPQVVYGLVPRRAVLAVSTWGEQLEYLVDYEQLTDAHIGRKAAYRHEVQQIRSAFAGMALRGL